MPIHLRGMTPLLQVFDMPTSLRFYRDVLRFELAATSGDGDTSDWVLLRHGSVELMLNTMYERDARPPAADPTRVTHHTDVSLYFGLEDLDGAYAHLRASGADAKPPSVAPYGMRQLYVTDPDGYLLCFQCPVSDETRAQWQKWYAAGNE